MKAPTTAAALAALVTFAALAPATAGVYPSHNDLDKRPVEAIAGELGVTADVFVGCFYNVEPDPDFAPTKAQERANKAILLPCLQAANSAITNDLLDDVMDKYRGQHVAESRR